MIKIASIRHRHDGLGAALTRSNTVIDAETRTVVQRQPNGELLTFALEHGGDGGLASREVRPGDDCVLIGWDGKTFAVPLPVPIRVAAGAGGLQRQQPLTRIATVYTRQWMRERAKTAARQADDARPPAPARRTAPGAMPPISRQRALAQLVLGASMLVIALVGVAHGLKRLQVLTQTQSLQPIDAEAGR